MIDLRRLAILLSGAFIACTGPRLIEAGDGITVGQAADRQAVSVDTTRVPVVSGCPEGQFVKRTSSGWACTDITSAVSSRLDTVTGDFERRLQTLEMAYPDLEAQVAALSARRADLMTALAQAQAQLDAKVASDRAIPQSTAAVTCVPSDAALTRGYTAASGKLTHQGTDTGTLLFYCPVLAFDHQPSWSRLVLTYQDSDGPGTDAIVRARLDRIGTSDGQVSTLATVTSSRTGVMQGGASFTHSFDFSAAVYFVEIELTRQSNTAVATAISFRIE
jgi:hypothetical protein